jgi:PKD domain
MKLSRYILCSTLLAIGAAGCVKQKFNDISFATSAASPTNLGMMFEITQDNKGLVTITPSGAGASSYDVLYGDTTATAVNVMPGKNTRHNYAEGTYTVKLTAHDLKGGTSTFSQPLTVSFKPPENLKANITLNGLTVSVSATALFETNFRVSYGDSTAAIPVHSDLFLEGQTVTHTYANAGTYVVTVTALSGGTETTKVLDTLKASVQINLPVTFEDPKTDYTMSDFGGEVSVLSADPANASNHVMKSTKTSGAATFAGVTIGTGAGFSSAIPLTLTATRMSVMVYSPAAGLDVKLKVDDHTRSNAGFSVETDVLTTVANQWETLTFDFSHPAAGTPAFNIANKYDLATIFFDFGNTGANSTFYFDNLMFIPSTLAQINLPVTFDDTHVDYTVTDFGGNVSLLSTDPVNGSNHVMKSTKTAGAQTFAGTTLGGGSGFASLIPLTAVAQKMTVKVYSPAVGLDVKLKLDDHTRGNTGFSVETDVLTTVANQWETLTFDMSKPATGTPAWSASNHYDLATIFFDFGNNGTGAVFYWDEVHFLAQTNLPVDFNNPDMDKTVSDFGGLFSALAADPTDPTRMAMQSTKPTSGLTYAGTTMGTPVGFPTAVPLSSTRLKMTVRVYSPAIGMDIKLKFDDQSRPNAGYSVETDALTTVANQWETLTFDFSQPAPTTPAWNPANTYNLASIFFDFNVVETSPKVFFWNNVILL